MKSLDIAGEPCQLLPGAPRLVNPGHQDTAWTPSPGHTSRPEVGDQTGKMGTLTVLRQWAHGALGTGDSARSLDTQVRPEYCLGHNHCKNYFTVSEIQI